MASKDAYLRRIEAELDEWTARASAARANLAGRVASGRIAASRHWDEAVDDVRGRVEEVRAASEAAWAAAKDRLDRAMVRLRELGGAVEARR